MHVRDPDAADVGEGLVTRVGDWRSELPWVRDAGQDGVVLFETATDGALQDSLRAGGFHVIGGSAAGDRLESEREFGQKLLSTLGLPTAETHVFVDFEDAARFVRERRRRYVYKPDGAGFASSRTYVSQLEDGTDMLAVLARQSATWPVGTPVRFVLMQHLSGVEMGVGAYFNGRQFLRPACLDWEHKRFFSGRPWRAHRGDGHAGDVRGERAFLRGHPGASRAVARGGRLLRVHQPEHRGECRRRVAARVHLSVWIPRVCRSFGAPARWLGRTLPATPVRRRGLVQEPARVLGGGRAQCPAIPSP